MINPFERQPRAFRAWLGELIYPLVYTLSDLSRYEKQRPLPPAGDAPCYVCTRSGACVRCAGTGRTRYGAPIDVCPGCKGTTYCWRCGGAGKVEIDWWKRWLGWRFHGLVHVIVLLLLITTAYAGSRKPHIPPPDKTGTLLGPGNKIGAMVLSADESAALGIGEFCDYWNFHDGPGSIAHPETTELDCDATVPSGARLIVADGWMASDQATLEANWKVMSWELYIDGQQVDLPAFGTTDRETSGSGSSVRSWNVALENLTPGRHTRRSIFRVNQEVFDGEATYPVGTYDIIQQFTVAQN